MRILIGFLWVTLLSCNYLSNVKLLTGGSINDKNYVHTIPFDYVKGLIVINGLVNDDDIPRQFIFDTGAFNSKIEKGLADSLSLESYATKDNSTAAGVSRKIEVTRLDSIRFGDALFKKIGAGKLDYDPLSASPCIADDGIIGANLIKLAHWKIDFQHTELMLSDSPLTPPENVTQSSIKFKRPVFSGVPDIEIQVGERTVSGVLFDVGFNGGLILPARFSELFTSESETKVIDRSTSGIYGSNTDTLITKDLEVSLGDFSFNIPVEFSSIGKALLGNEILEHFNVYINNKSNRITLVPISEVEVPHSLSFIPGVLNDSLWVVTRTNPNLNLQLGDTLLSINGKKPSDLFINHCDHFMNIRDLLINELELENPDGSILRIQND